MKKDVKRSISISVNRKFCDYLDKKYIDKSKLINNLIIQFIDNQENLKIFERKTTKYDI